MNSSSKTPEIVYEEENFFIVNKPPGYYSHPNHLDHQVDSLVSYFSDQMDFPDLPQEQAEVSQQEALKLGNLRKLRKGLVHRLDRETSGLMILAKNPPALDALQGLFKRREVVKKYQGLVHGHLFEHHKSLVHKLIRDPYHRSRRKVLSGKASSENIYSNKEQSGGGNSKVAETEVTPLAFFKGHTLLDIRIFTGRTHQIRVQLSHEGFPIVGDSVYGKRNQKGPTFLMLCAYSLEFTSPFSGEVITQKVELPDYFSGYMGRLEKYLLLAKNK